MIKYFALVALLTLNACAYDVQVRVQPAKEIYTAYQKPLEGRYALFVQTGTWSSQVRATSWTCKAHTYPLDANSAFHMAAVQTLNQIVAEGHLVSQAVPQESLEEHGYVAQIAVHTASFAPEITFAANLFSVTAVASVKASVHVGVLTPEGLALQTTVTSQQTASAPGGGACGGGGDALSQALSAAMQDILERVAERVANAPTLRHPTKVAQ